MGACALHTRCSWPLLRTHSSARDALRLGGRRTQRCHAAALDQAQAAAAEDTPAASSSHEPECSISYRGHAFSVPCGTRLRTALLRNGVSPHNGRAQLINCRGLGTCGTCAVQVREGVVAPEAWTPAEQLRLNFPPHRAPNNQRLRLACQVTCQGPALQVVKRDGFWGQGDTELGPAGPGEYAAAGPPLGPLAYVLDREATPAPGQPPTGGQQRRQQQQQQERSRGSSGDKGP